MLGCIERPQAPGEMTGDKLAGMAILSIDGGRIAEKSESAAVKPGGWILAEIFESG